MGGRGRWRGCRYRRVILACNVLHLELGSECRACYSSVFDVVLCAVWLWLSVRTAVIGRSGGLTSGSASHGLGRKMKDSAYAVPQPRALQNNGRKCWLPQVKKGLRSSPCASNLSTSISDISQKSESSILVHLPHGQNHYFFKKRGFLLKVVFLHGLSHG